MTVDPAHHGRSAGATAPRHEPVGSDIRGPAAFGIGLVVAIALVLMGAAWLYKGLSRRWAAAEQPVPFEAERRQPPPVPRLEVDDAGDLRRLRDAENAILNSYGWVDRKRGVVRIPVDRAMRLLAVHPTTAPAETKETSSDDHTSATTK